jgi:superfamily II DNA/RNA helicase
VLGFEYMTAVQEASLPVVLEGGDVMARAKTGTGKMMLVCRTKTFGKGRHT